MADVDDGDSIHVASIVRPYALTKGRTAPRVDLPVEATIEVVSAEKVGDDIGRSILDLCAAQNPSVAEIAAQLRQPLGVTRVLLADLVDVGAVSVRATLTDRATDRQRHDLIERTLRGLRAL
ncbi:DUF742 domain-containing protein [Phycicoccus sp. CSK15P-2]|uniref:DUF742 domain-containing protein n=1 Tax=Phycicoccus sp. CSK15P-2 TaxID=2807627 RepID=UPI0019506477|nr:DUF742 domain-containing protein [Phycicoccus sp. CSK15P-2]MBM6404647.1 DUF742 domain-containing protein [Phycicoccus sp. CSK15P-2]